MFDTINGPVKVNQWLVDGGYNENAEIEKMKKNEPILQNLYAAKKFSTP